MFIERIKAVLGLWGKQHATRMPIIAFPVLPPPVYPGHHICLCAIYQTSGSSKHRKFPLENLYELEACPEERDGQNKEQGTDISPKTNPLLPILLNAIFNNINTRGKEFTMLLPWSHSIGDVVARGHHLHVRLRSQNWEFSTPLCINYATDTKQQQQQ
jgi:hypothetical protein